MASTIPGFNAQEVRDGIHLAMSIGLPPAVEDRPRFIWDPEVDPSTQEDEGGTPFQWDAEAETPVAPPHTDVTDALCAVEYFDSAGDLQPFGPMASSHLLLTLLDVDYAKVNPGGDDMFSAVIIGGNRYEYERTATPMGLDSIGVWQIHVRADDEG